MAAASLGWQHLLLLPEAPLEDRVVMDGASRRCPSSLPQVPHTCRYSFSLGFSLPSQRGVPSAAGRDGETENITAEQEMEIKTKGEARQPGEGGVPHCLALAVGLDGDPRDATPLGWVPGACTWVTYGGGRSRRCSKASPRGH